MPDTVQPEWMKDFKPAPGPTGNAAWVKGMRSPNPAGRPRGIKDKRVRVAQQMLDDAGAIVDTMITKALDGDAQAAALILSRVLPTLRSEGRTVQFNFDPTVPVSQQIEMVLHAISQGEVSPDVGKQIIEAIQALGSIRDMEALEQRINELEAKQA